MPGIDKECEGEGATHYPACKCREEYFRKMEEALRELLDTLVRTSVYSPGIQMGKTQLAQAWNKARKALGEE